MQNNLTTTSLLCTNRIPRIHVPRNNMKLPLIYDNEDEICETCHQILTSNHGLKRNEAFIDSHDDTVRVLMLSSNFFPLI